jgi:Putative peptidoglycan binding domain
MNEPNSSEAAYDLFDSLTPYEIAILVFTSPRVVEVPSESETHLVTLTGKEAYLWAGAIAHVIVRRPESSADSIAGILHRVLMSAVRRQAAREGALGSDYRAWRYRNSDREPVESFLREAGLGDEQDLVFRRTYDAMQSLIWRGYIEDPFTKKVGLALVAVLLNLPIGFTQPGPHEVHLSALTWEYAQRPQEGHVQRQFRFKVKEVSEVVLQKIVPSMIEVVDTLSGTNSTGISTEDLQTKLANLGYYHGSIDGIVGRKTVDALRHFQADHYLEQTGHPDAATIQRLK